jgi:hypothetical protein
MPNRSTAHIAQIDVVYRCSKLTPRPIMIFSGSSGFLHKYEYIPKTEEISFGVFGRNITKNANVQDYITCCKKISI